MKTKTFDLRKIIRENLRTTLCESKIKVFHKGRVEEIPGNFVEGDRVVTFDLPKGSPYADREGTVVHSQPDDVRVRLDGMTDEYGEGFLPKNLIRIPPSEATDDKKKFHVLTPQEKKQMMFDALTMSETGWMKKYHVGDYGDYKEMAGRLLGTSGVDFSKVSLNEENAPLNEDVQGLYKWLPLIRMEQAGLRVLTIPQLKKQLTGKKDSATVMFFDWHNKGGEMCFPTELKIIDLKDYEVQLKHPIYSSRNTVSDLKGGKMIMFETEGLPRFGREYRESESVKSMKKLPLPKHLTVGDFKKKLAGLGGNAFFAVRHHGNDFVSPDLIMNYNTETYPLSDKKGNLYGADLKNGDIQTFGLGSTMSTDWGPFTFSLEPKQKEPEGESSLEGGGRTDEMAFLKNEARKSLGKTI